MRSAKMENETQRDAYAMQLFGKSAQALNPLIEAGSETLNQFAKDAVDSGYVLSGEALTALNDYQDSLDRLSKQKDALSNAIGVAAAPAFKVFTDNADGALQALTQLINGDISAGDFAKEIGEAVGNIADYITEALPKLMEAGAAIIETIMDAISTNLPKTGKRRNSDDNNLNWRYYANASRFGSSGHTNIASSN